MIHIGPWWLQVTWREIAWAWAPKDPIFIGTFQVLSVTRRLVDSSIGFRFRGSVCVSEGGTVWIGMYWWETAAATLRRVSRNRFDAMAAKYCTGRNTS